MIILQCGFKKFISCPHAIFTVRSVINHYTTFGSTVNLCAINISKAFDRMNHIGMFLKLMDRLWPVNVLLILEKWFKNCYTCVKWGSITSCMFHLTRGIRQGGVLSPYLFAVYVNDLMCWTYSLWLFLQIYMHQYSHVRWWHSLPSPSVTALQSTRSVAHMWKCITLLYINPYYAPQYGCSRCRFMRTFCSFFILFIISFNIWFLYRQGVLVVPYLILIFTFMFEAFIVIFHQEQVIMD